MKAKIRLGIGVGILIILSAFILGLSPDNSGYTSTYKEVVSETPVVPALSSDALNSLQKTRNDYIWRLDLINEQQRRIDTLYAVKAGVIMIQQEFNGWLDTIRAAEDEYSTRANNALYGGENYSNLLGAYKSSLDSNFYNSEIEMINKNHGIITSDLKGNLYSLNRNIDKYNNCFVNKTGCS